MKEVDGDPVVELPPSMEPAVLNLMTMMVRQLVAVPAVAHGLVRIDNQRFEYGERLLCCRACIVDMSKVS